MMVYPQTWCRPASHLRDVVLTALLLAVSAAVSAQTVTTNLPQHARENHLLGEGWTCSRGFVRDGQICARVVVPAHAYLDSSGDEWDCDRGYLRSDQGCTAVKVPANAHAVDPPSLNGWECDRGYEEDEANDVGCSRIIVPADAHLTDYAFGGGWGCNWGYRPDGRRCVAVEVCPAMAFSHPAATIGNAHEVSRSTRPLAWLCKCRSMDIWTIRETRGDVSVHSDNRALPACR